jgi:hypothetical protein
MPRGTMGLYLPVYRTDEDHGMTMVSEEPVME